MPVDPEDFKNIGEDIAESFDGETAYRCVINREYYYVFLYIRENGSSYSGVNFNGKGDHGKAADLLLKTGDKDLHDDFRQLMRRRHRADYELEQEFTELDYKEFSELLKSVMTRIQYIEFKW